MIIGTFLVCSRLASVLFNLESIFSYVFMYFTLGFDSVTEPLSMPIRVSTPVGDSLVVDQAYRSCVVTFAGRETLVDLLVLDMVDFDAIFEYRLVGSFSCHLKPLCHDYDFSFVGCAKDSLEGYTSFQP